MARQVMKNITKILTGAVVILAALLIAQNLYYFSGGRIKGQISSGEASKKAMDYINSVLLQDQTAATLVEAKSENGVYALKIKLEDQDYTLYITKDGKVLFPQGGIVISENTEEPKTSEVIKKDKTEAMLFVMSFCPYGNQAEETMMNVVDLLGDKADIQLHYVIYGDYQGGGSQYCLDKENKYCSMHGIQELNQDVRELCVQKYQKDKFWNFVKQINVSCSASNVDTCWVAVAQKSEVDVNKVKTCQTSEAITLLKNEVELGKKYEISGSPQLIINDKEFSGTRSAEGYKAAICSGFNTAPTECSTSLGTDSGTTPTGGCE